MTKAKQIDKSSAPSLARPQRLCRAILLLSLSLLTGCTALAKDTVNLDPRNQRKALVLGSALRRNPSDGPTHPEGAKMNFLKLVGNPSNDPRKGWTCDLSWDLMKKLGMNPTNTPVETLFRYIGEHKLGYRIVINNGASGCSLPFWGVALDNGMMPFAPQGNNTPNLFMGKTSTLGSAVAVAGGRTENVTSCGATIELIDALPVWASHSTWEDAAQSWANQATAAKFTKILDANPSYNIWDARQHLRQAASFWSKGWSETNGFGRVKEGALVKKLLPGPPVDFRATLSRNRNQVHFRWRNFLQSDFAATVIARKDGRIIYEGNGTNFTWTSDVSGEETFRYWSKNRAGEISRLEAFQAVTVRDLKADADHSCLILGAPVKEDRVNSILWTQFQKGATNWICDMVYRTGNPVYDQVKTFPQGPLAAVLPDVTSMVDFAISNRYRIVIVPSSSEGALFDLKDEWDRAVMAGILVVQPHCVEPAKATALATRTESPPRLYSAITVAEGATNQLRSFGPGLEFVESNVFRGVLPRDTAELEAASVAAKLARILDANPGYNHWDARQHLRQSASHYADGWSETRGYGRPADEPVRIEKLDVAPPVDMEVIRAPDGKSVTFRWMNFRQSIFSQTVIQRGDGRTIYEGGGTNFVWRSDVDGTETFQFFSKDKEGRMSRAERYTVFTVSDLKKN